MFDRNVYTSGAQHHHHTTEIREYRAPTDQSVKLLREMEQEAEKRLLATVRLNGCVVDCVIHHMTDSMRGANKFILQYQLGTNRRTVRHDVVDTGESQQERREKVARELVSVLAEDIARELLMPAMPKELWQSI